MIHFAMLEAQLVDKVLAFVAPKILGGSQALTAVAGKGFAKLSDAVELENFTVRQLGADFLLSGCVRRSST